MFPVLFSLGGISISSLGVFLALGFLLSIFLVWRLARAWDLDEEKVLDLTLLTFVGGLIFSRAYFILGNFQFFELSFLKWMHIFKYPGFSFWGGLLGGWLTLFIFARRFKLDFWQLADIASVGLLGGLILTDLGCFFASCGVGLRSNLFFAVPMVGVIGKRLPIQLVEALLLSLALFKIWSQATHFHQRGKIVSLTLIYLGFIKLCLEPLKQFHGGGYYFDSVLILLGLTIFYKVTKRNIFKDLQNAPRFAGAYFSLQNLSKSWYNQKTSFAWKLRNIKKILLLTLRRFNVKFSYKNS